MVWITMDGLALQVKSEILNYHLELTLQSWLAFPSYSFFVIYIYFCSFLGYDMHWHVNTRLRKDVLVIDEFLWLFRLAQKSTCQHKHLEDL